MAKGMRKGPPAAAMGHGKKGGGGSASRNTKGGFAPDSDTTLKYSEHPSKILGGGRMDQSGGDVHSVFNPKNGKRMGC